MRATVPLLAIGLLAGSLQLGCQSTQPPPRIPIPADTRGNPNVTYGHDPVKPMPRPSETSDADLVPPGHGDPDYGRSHESTDRFQSTGPGEYRESPAPPTTNP